ncbi:MAG: class I SAM-dependent DNA methyltransferase, partial [Deltaproteobacteria bacterium]|nr:class I SAM-dependent DNA methyltransferase [Deltaproteobacteria bacterium]
MNRDQSYALIRQTFTQGFDKARFQNFAVNLLNRIDESKAQAWNNTYVKDAFKNDVSRYERLGTYTSPDNEKLDVLIVHLTGETKLARARTAIRNFVAYHLKTRDEKDSALVAFVSPTEKQWRFSYVKMEYATVEKESGKVGVETRLTPARRFSYIVGDGESCHTAQTRFLSLLQDTKTDPKLADIEEAFSVEAVTKEFFKRYVELFENIHQALDKIIKKDNSIHDEFQSRNVNTVDFAKKLMGQIVFLYFLQKKGWLGVEKGKAWGTGPHDFLRRLAGGEYGAYENYFNNILEPLFYDTLATDRGHEAWCRHFKCRIPFLNGGLFEALGGYDWSKTDILLPNRLFTNNDPVEEGITGTGVLDVFDRYNFTVNEAEPLEKEVAIDPEMLGKVFENLIEENRRKGLGAYYTPREIVHYMCQENLINYLDTSLNKEKELVPRNHIETFIHLGDQAAHYEAARMSGTKTYKPELPKGIEMHARLIDDKLIDIIVCDPAVGSGAFPVGMMAEIVRARSALT